MATAAHGRGLELPRLHRVLRLGKPLAVVAIIAVMVVAYPLLKNDELGLLSKYGLRARLQAGLIRSFTIRTMSPVWYAACSHFCWHGWLARRAHAAARRAWY